MISTCIYMYEHIEKISKIFPGKSKISQKNVQMINIEVHESQDHLIFKDYWDGKLDS